MEVNINALRDNFSARSNFFNARLQIKVSCFFLRNNLVDYVAEIKKLIRFLNFLHNSIVLCFHNLL